MTRLALCCCALVSLFAGSCASERRPELPSDQETKVRQHRIAPSEDLEQTGQTKEGSPVPPTRESSWKF
ncbi:MAG TPA: hypothetical protein VM511_05685 [Luteolibacter sp.]|nr:hypothetical protein [Luteolibacter sp.]